MKRTQNYECKQINYWNYLFGCLFWCSNYLQSETREFFFGGEGGGTGIGTGADGPGNNDKR